MLFFSVQVSTPVQCYARQTSKGTFFWAGKVRFYVCMFETLASRGLEELPDRSFLFL